ncbi:MAG: aminotransferase class IV [Bdellovibrionales bacterium]
MSRSVMSPEQIFKQLQARKVENLGLKAGYLSWLGGIVTDPRWILIPLDDHMVHRGDGVFEAIKFKNNKPYLFEPHLRRLQESAEAIALKIPGGLKEVELRVTETLEASGLHEGLIRIFVSRGGGSFSTNPYDCATPGLAVVVMELKTPAPEKYERGVKAGRSHIFPKPDRWSQIKSCNYLPNVMMKKESVDRGLDFTVSFTEQGFLAESSTENMILVDHHGLLCRPKLDRILKGCTMTRVFELAQKHHVSQTFERDLTEDDLRQAREVMMVGTTLDVLPVTQYEGRFIGDGHVGPVARRLQELLLKDQG